jgi:hypothetical protein
MSTSFAPAVNDCLLMIETRQGCPIGPVFFDRTNQPCVRSANESGSFASVVNVARLWGVRCALPLRSLPLFHEPNASQPCCQIRRSIALRI